MRFKMMVLAAATVLSVPAIAQTADPAAGASKPKPKKEKKICRSSGPSSYSRMSRSVCRTQAEWDRNGEIERDDNASVRSASGDGVSSR